MKAELEDVRGEFETLSKIVKKLTSGTQQLKDILNEGRLPKNRMGLGFSKKCQASMSTTIFVKASDTSNTSTENKKDQVNHHTKRKRWVCHFYGKPGHIRPFCFYLYGFPD